MIGVLLVYLLALIGLLALASLAAAFLLEDSDGGERARIEREVRSAERRLHEIARSSFAAMLEEARVQKMREGK